MHHRDNVQYVGDERDQEREKPTTRTNMPGDKESDDPIASHKFDKVSAQMQSKTTKLLELRQSSVGNEDARPKQTQTQLCKTPPVHLD